MKDDRARSPQSELAVECTGPRTRRGKVRSSRNAVKLGLYAKSAVVSTRWFKESPARFRRLQASLVQEFRPQSTIQWILLDDFAATTWQLARVARIRKLMLETSGQQTPTAYANSFWKQLAADCYCKATDFNLEPEPEARKRATEMLAMAKTFESAAAEEKPDAVVSQLVELMQMLEILDRRESHLRRIWWRLKEEIDRVFNDLRPIARS